MTPHTWRHSVGVQLVAAGVDVTVIRNWLGDARLDTTNHYARANLETKTVREQTEVLLEGGRRRSAVSAPLGAPIKCLSRDLI